jgi:hypothetical protein
MIEHSGHATASVRQLESTGLAQLEPKIVLLLRTPEADEQVSGVSLLLREVAAAVAERPRELRKTGVGGHRTLVSDEPVVVASQEVRMYSGPGVLALCLQHLYRVASQTHLKPVSVLLAGSAVIEELCDLRWCVGLRHL